MQNICVAGGAGFIGSNLCEKLLQEDYFVICIDNLLTGNKENIVHLLNNKNFLFINEDITALSVSTKQQLVNVDFIFHLASPASPNKKSAKSYINYPIETLLVNSLGTYNLLEIARSAQSRFLLASTSEIYGDPVISPQQETYWGNVNPNGVRAVYDEAKRFAEAMTMAYFRKYNLNVRIMRIFNTYGPKMQIDDGRVVSNLINQALRNEPLTVYGKGDQTRSFCYITDLIQGITKLMFTDNLAGEVVNLGNPIEYTILEFAKIIQELTKTKSAIVFEDLPEDDPKQRQPDIAKAKQLLNWEPQVNLQTGLNKTIEYFANL